MLKIVGVIAGIAGAAVTLGASLGISAALLGAISVGASVGASLLAKRPKSPQASPETLDRLNASIDPRTPRKMVFGRTAMATDIRDQEYTDSQTYLHRFIVVAAHKVQAIEEIWFDDKKAWTVSGGVQGEYVGFLTVTPILEGSAGNAINISARMGSTRRFTGLAYVHLRYKLTGNSKKADSPFAQGIATRMTIRGKGAFVYDPRLDSTVPGGSGSHRADDQSTWTWSDDASRNPALQLLWYMLGWKINGKLSVGRGIPPARIDLESFAVAANLCDEVVSLVAGGTEPRYRADGVFSEADSPTVVIDNFKAAMNADLDDVGGKLRLTVFHNDLADPVAAFTDDDMIEGFNWKQTPSLVESFNIVRGSYTDPSDTSLYQMVDYPQVELESRDGIERPDSFDLALVQSPSQAQRLAKQRLQRQQYGGEFQTTWGARGWRVQKNSVVTQTVSALGWVDKLFRVAEMEHRVDGTCPVVLREENADIYAWDESESPAVEPADPTVYDFTLSPIYQGIDDAGGTADWSEIFDDNGNKPEDNADVTANAQIVVVPPPTFTIYRTALGAVKAGQLPATLRASVMRGGVDITQDNDTDYAVTGSAGLSGKVSVDTTDGSSTKADITLDNTITGAGAVQLSVTVGGVDIGTYAIQVVTNDDSPPVNNGTAGGTDSSLPALSTTSYVVMTNLDGDDPVMDVGITSGQTLRLSANFYYNTGSTAPRTMTCKAEYYDGATWQAMSDAGADHVGTAAQRLVSPPEIVEGEMLFTFTKTGLSTDTYPVRLLGKVTSGAGTITPTSGSVTSSRA